MISLVIFIICSATVAATVLTVPVRCEKVPSFPFKIPEEFPETEEFRNVDISTLPYNEQVRTIMLTNEDLTQSRLLKQISKYLLENYSQFVPGRHILSLADLDTDGYGSKNPPTSRFGRTVSDNIDGDFVVISPGCYEIPVNLFGRRMLMVEVTQSEPVGLESRLSI